MAQEIEIKVRAVDLSDLRARLQDLGASLSTAREFEDNHLLDDASRRLRSRGEALRVRQAGGQTILTWKGPRTLRDGLRIREELEVRCDDPATLMTILGQLGLLPVFRYQKYRETWRLDTAEVVLDSTPIGDFFEIEGEEPVVRRLVEQLGVQPQDIVTDSYATLFSRALQDRGQSTDAMVFDGPSGDGPGVDESSGDEPVDEPA